MARKTHKGLWILLLHVLSFLVSLLPLGIVLAVNFGKYTETVPETVKLCAGGVILVVFVVLKVLGKLKMPRRIVFYALVFAGAWLFAALLEDLLLLSFAALLGEAVDYIVLQPIIARLKRTREREKTADETAERVEEILDRYIGGRV